MTRKLTDLKHIMASKPTKAPVTISPDNTIIDGHARYLAYKAMECPIIIVEQNERLLSISDNK